MARHRAPVTRENLIRRLAQLLDGTTELTAVQRAELVADSYDDLDELRGVVEAAEKADAPAGEHAAFRRHGDEQWDGGLTR